MRSPPSAGGRGGIRSGTGGGVEGPLTLCRRSPKLGMEHRGGQAHEVPILSRPAAPAQTRFGPIFPHSLGNRRPSPQDRSLRCRSHEAGSVERAAFELRTRRPRPGSNGTLKMRSQAADGSAARPAERDHRHAPGLAQFRARSGPTSVRSRCSAGRRPPAPRRGWRGPPRSPRRSPCKAGRRGGGCSW